MAPEMKGLAQFLTDLRNSREEGEEDRTVQAELVHIQKQFQQSKLSGYNRKKYICKLLYVQLLGNRLSFGFDQAIQLTRSKVLGEKMVGYQAVGVFVEQDMETMNEGQWESIFESIDLDLAAKNMDMICCGVQAVADLCEYNSMIITRRYEARIYGALRSPEFEDNVHQKAALTMAKLLKLDPSILARHPEYLSRIIPMIHSTNLGMVLAVVPILEVVARVDSVRSRPCITLAVSKLDQLITKQDCPKEYYFHNVMAPFVLVKLFKLLELLIPDTTSVDSANHDQLQKIIQTAIQTSITTSMSETCSPETRDSAKSVLFAALSLAPHVDPDSDQACVAANALCGMLKSTDANTRYLALGALLKLAARDNKEIHQVIDNNLETVSVLLRDKDVSVRRRAMDLVYMMCNSNNVEKTCSEFLGYLEISEFSIRSEVAVKVAVLAEKYATDPVWFVVTISKLLSLAGNYVNDDVWCRMAQIVVNNNNIQPVACRTLIRYLKGGDCPDSIIKLGSFLLGEFGQTVTDTLALEDQFYLINSFYLQSGAATRSIMLTAFLKYYAKSPVLHERIGELFEQEGNSFSPEIQQRALEYSAVIKTGNTELLKSLTSAMPPFTSKGSPLIARLGTLHELKESFILPEYRSSSPLRNSRSPSPSRPLAPSPRKTPQRLASIPALTPSKVSLTPSRASLSASRTSLGGSTSSLISPTKVPRPPPSRKLTSASGSSNRLSTYSNNSVNRLSVYSNSSSLFETEHTDVSLLSSGWEDGYYRLCRFDQGIFYENSMMVIVYRLKRERSVLHVSLTFSNKSPYKISGLVSEMAAVSDAGYSVKTLNHPDSTITEGGKTKQEFDVTLNSMFQNSSCPTLVVSFMAGSLNTVNLRVPTILLKGISAGAPLSKLDFFMRWSQIDQGLGLQGQGQVIVELAKPTITSILGRFVSNIGLENLREVDDNQLNVVGAGILNMISSAAAVLLRIEPNPETPSVLRLTVRATVPGLASLLTDSISEVMRHTL